MTSVSSGMSVPWRQDPPTIWHRRGGGKAGVATTDYDVGRCGEEDG
jgi:hypothetical protein